MVVRVGAPRLSLYRSSATAGCRKIVNRLGSFVRANVSGVGRRHAQRDDVPTTAWFCKNLFSLLCPIVCSGFFSSIIRLRRLGALRSRHHLPSSGRVLMCAPSRRSPNPIAYDAAQPFVHHRFISPQNVTGERTDRPPRARRTLHPLVRQSLFSVVRLLLESRTDRREAVVLRSTT